MEGQMIAPEIIKKLSKEIFIFSNFWFEKYFKPHILLEENLVVDDYLEVTREQIFHTVIGGLKTMGSGRISEEQYLSLGALEAKNGVSIETLINNQYILEQAVEDYLRMRMNAGDWDISEQDIQNYLMALKKLHDQIMPILLDGYRHYKDTQQKQE